VEPPLANDPVSTCLQLGVLIHPAAEVVVGHTSLDRIYEALETHQDFLDIARAQNKNIDSYISTLKAHRRVVIVTFGR
jgi:hypothetical protein